jgi:hypothetical protein
MYGSRGADGKRTNVAFMYIRREIALQQKARATAGRDRASNTVYVAQMALGGGTRIWELTCSHEVYLHNVR